MKLSRARRDRLIVWATGLVMELAGFVGICLATGIPLAGIITLSTGKQFTSQDVLGICAMSGFAAHYLREYLRLKPRDDD